MKSNDSSRLVNDSSPLIFHRNARSETRREHFCLTIMQFWRTCGLRYENLLLSMVRKKMHSFTKKRKNSQESIDVTMFDPARLSVSAIVVIFGLWMFLLHNRRKNRQIIQETCTGASLYRKKGKRLKLDPSRADCVGRVPKTTIPKEEERGREKPRHNTNSKVSEMSTESVTEHMPEMSLA